MNVHTAVGKLVHDSGEDGLKIRALPLTAEAFAPYGRVIEHRGEARRLYLDDAFWAAPPAHQPRLWISRASAATALPLIVTEMEHHPYSAQTFMPLGPARFVAVVAQGAATHAPAPEAIRAFVSAPGQGVTYFPGIWHGSLSVIVPGDFMVAMSLTGQGDDDVFRPLSRAVCITMDAFPSF